MTSLPRAVIFDWDNTLVDTWPVIHAALAATFEEFGRTPWSFDETRLRVRKSLRDSFPGLFGDAWEAAGDAFYRHFEAMHLQGLAPLPGAEEVLGHLGARSVPMAVVSNKRGSFLRKEIGALGWDGHFAAAVGATDAARDKPAPDPVALALAPTGVAPSGDVWFVGDADIDIECARASGLTGVLVRAEPPAPGEFDALMPDRYCPTLTALRAALEGS